MGKGKEKQAEKSTELKGNDGFGMLTEDEISARQDAIVHTAEDAKAAAEAEDRKPLGKYGKAYEAGRDKAEGLNVKIVKWTDVGQKVIGKFLSQDVLPDTKFETPVQRYVIQTDEGIVSCLLGSATDKELVGKLREGDMVYIEFQGQTDIGKNRSVNNFKIEKFGHEGE